MQENNSFSRVASIAIIVVIYLMALVVGVWTFGKCASCGMSDLWGIFIADAAATVLVWWFGIIFRNVSVYDPYWSVVPPVVLTIWLFTRGTLNTASLLLLIAVWYWGIRLTANWVITFKGLAYEDWRYTKYREEKKPFVFQLINFFGLNFVPTIVVFLAMVPGLGLIAGQYQATPLTWLAFALCLACPTIQLIADTQSHRFRREHPGKVCTVGLWKHGRHPNYFGEVMMWWGVWFMFVSAAGFSANVWYVAGAIANTLLFLFISIPMMEKRQLARKPEYAEYRSRTRLFI